MGTQDPIAYVSANRALTRAAQVLTGIVTGIVADGELHDSEIHLLNVWLAENAAVADIWPGSAIATAIRHVLADGVITTEERAHLLSQLQGLVGTDFAETGSSSASVVALPYDNNIDIVLTGAYICHTGEFLFGTRAACERLSERAGAIPASSVSKKIAYLVVGTHVSPAWANTAYGRKIQQAMELKLAGHRISILPEQSWLEACSN